MKLLQYLMSGAACISFLLLVHADQQLAQDKARRLGRRADDLSFCFGEDAICSIMLDLQDECHPLDIGYTHPVPYYQCACANGYVTASQACSWCENAYNISTIVGGIDDIRNGWCKSLSLPAAPVPTSLIDRMSSFNATYTGTVISATQAGVQVTTTPLSSSARTSISPSLIVISRVTLTLDGAGGPTTGVPTITSTVQLPVTVTVTSIRTATATNSAGNIGVPVTLGFAVFYALSLVLVLV